MAWILTNHLVLMKYHQDGILKYCAIEISPVLQIIFTQSMLSGVLPNDWLSVNITPVFKKEIKETHQIIGLFH